YSLSEYGNRRGKPKPTIATIRQKFSQDLAKIDSIKTSEFWQIVQNALSQDPQGYFKPYIIQPGDTFESISKKFNIDIQELKELNPDVRVLRAGRKLVMKPDLTAKTSCAYDHRERIAMQLFPQATHFQIEAFQERLASRDEYLQSVLE